MTSELVTPSDDVALPVKDRRPLAIALAVIAAACLAYAALTKAWLANTKSPVAQIGFGLTGELECVGGGDGATCTAMSNGDFVEKWKQFDTSNEHVSSAFAPAGWITLAALILAALGLLGAAALAIARKRPQLPMSPSTVALLGLMASLISGCVFVATKPGPPGFVGVGASFWVFGIGAVLGIAGAQLLARVNRPADPDLMADAMNPDQF